MNNVSNLSDTIKPKSDQLNADDLMVRPMTITVTGVSRGTTNEQPISISFEGDNGKPYKPCKSMRRVIIFAWGDDGMKWIGRAITLYCDTNVQWAGVKVGGIRISHMSDIPNKIEMAITTTRGKRAPYIISPLIPKIALPVEANDDIKKSLEAAAKLGIDELKNAWLAIGGAMQKKVGGAEYLAELKRIAENDSGI